MTTLTRQQIETLWVQAGGNPQKASEASAIAMAESGGNPDAINNKNANGTTDRGLWQINSVHGSLSTLDPLANARAAVGISANGSNWRPWCVAWSNGACGGTFMGAGSPVLQFLGGEQLSPADPASPTGSPATQPVGLGSNLDPGAWANAFLKPIGIWAYAFGLFFVGGVMVLAGFFLIFKDTQAGQVAIGVGQRIYHGAKSKLSGGTLS